ncbi:MAG: serine/threonine-protein kinase [Planctomycetota bacterium]|nr:serine/threonine-protein kinase [Planctomycetota bacterium]
MTDHDPLPGSSTGPATTATRLEIAEAVLTFVEAGGELDVAELIARFPGQELEVRGVLGGLDAYQTRVTRERLDTAWVGKDQLLEIGRQVGDYRIEGVLGRGSMGVVYRAAQTSLGDRPVALKVLPPALVAKDPRFLERFRREAALASKVHHPGVAEVHDYGEQHGVVFFAMQLVEGRTLDAVLNGLAVRRRLGDPRHAHLDYVDRVVALVQDIARATAAIHAEGLVHRDLKPVNVVLQGSTGDDFEALACQPVVVDFGLLRPVSQSNLTGSRTLLGTESFASPEAQLGESVDARADVFSLGAVLHDLLGARRHDERGPASAGLGDPRALNPAVDRRLAAIVSMATERKASLRYADGAELCDELGRYRARRPIRALPTTPWGRLHMWMRRDAAHAYRVLAALAGAFLLLLGLVFVGTQAASAARTLRQAQQLEQRGELVRAGEALRSLWDQRAILEWLSGGGPELETARRVRELAADRVSHEPAELRVPTVELSMAQVYSDLEVGGRDGFRLAHDQLLMLLLTPGYEDLAGPLLAFLGRELEPDQPLWRRELAAESVAQLSVCEPKILGSGQVLPPAYQALADRLIAVLREGAHADLTRFALSGLSGLGSDSTFAELLALPRFSDQESERLRARALRRIFFGRDHQGELLPAALHHGWLDYGWQLLTDPRTFLEAPLHRGRDWRGTDWTFSGENHANVSPEVDNLAMEAFTAGALAHWRAAQDPDLMGRLDELRAHPLEPGAARLFEANLESLERLLAGQEVRPLPLLADFLIDELDADGALAEAIRFSSRGSRLTPITSLDEALAQVDGRRDHPYLNYWDQTTRLPSRAHAVPPELDAEPVARLSFEPDGPHLEGTAMQVRWSGAELITKPVGFEPYQRTFLELRAPRRAWVELTCKIPEGHAFAELVIGHRLAGRAPLPFTGSSEVRITVNGMSSKILPMLGTTSRRTGKQRSGLPVSRMAVGAADLVGFDTLTIRYDHSDGPNLVWLEALQVTFEQELPILEPPR